MPVLVVGIGNSWASDDGVGPEVVGCLQALDGELAGARLMVEAQPGLGLLDALDACDTAIIVDAVIGDAAPGTVHRLVWQPGVLAGRGLERASTHGFGVNELLELAATLGRLPPEVILWGVEISGRTPGQGLSPALATALPEVVAGLRQELAARVRGGVGK